MPIISVRLNLCEHSASAIIFTQASYPTSNNKVTMKYLFLNVHYRTDMQIRHEIYLHIQSQRSLPAISFLNQCDVIGDLMEHLKSWEGINPNLVEEMRKNLYVDDVMMTVSEVDEKRSQAIEIFEHATFNQAVQEIAPRLKAKR